MSSSRSRSTTLALTAALTLGSASLAPAFAQTAPDAVELQILTVNDFHGHLDPRTGGAASVAGVLGGAVAAARAANPNTVFVSAGDNIGASPFISSSQQDAPTIDVLNEMGLAVSAVGNHEFDRGYADLAGRVSARAAFPHLGANVAGESPELPEHAVVTTASGVAIGFVGVVTQQTASLVSPAGIAGITFTDPVAAANRVARDLSDGAPGNGEADVVVLLAHEGAETAATAAADCATLGSRDDAFGKIVNGASTDVDVIFGGHTHLRVDCEFTLSNGQVRPVLEGGQYGEALSRLRLTWSTAQRRITAVNGEVLPLTATSYPADPDVEAIVRSAAAAADVIGREVVGRITADIPRAFTPGGAEDRGAESLLGNFIADVQRSAVPGTQIAFMNPGGLRDDLLVGDISGGEGPGEVTYAEAAVVQPFANTLFTLTLTGAQVKQVLEEQYQPAGSTRPFLALGVSRGLRYGFDDSAPRGSRIHSLTLDGVPLDPAATYRIVTNSFLASGGDNFTTLGRGANRTDTGLDDLSVLVGYFRANSPITPDTTDRAVPGPAPDATGPTVVVTPTPGAPTGTNGWYTAGPVTVGLAFSDASGVDEATRQYRIVGNANDCGAAGATWLAYPAGGVTVTAQGTSVVCYRAADNAGNVTTGSFTVRIDSIAPTVTLPGVAADGSVSDAVYLVPAVTDAAGSSGSLVVTAMTLDGAPWNPARPVNAAELSLGSHTLTVTAADSAGNSATTTLTFRTVASYEGLRALVARYTASGALSASTGRSLTALLEQAEGASSAGRERAALNQFAARVRSSVDSTGVRALLLRDAAAIGAALRPAGAAGLAA